MMPRREATRVTFTTWIERTIHLPLGTAAKPGRIKLPVYLREVPGAFTARGVERITVQKSAPVFDPTQRLGPLRPERERDVGCGPPRHPGAVECGFLNENGRPFAAASIKSMLHS
jgi:hypothetical protein